MVLFGKEWFLKHQKLLLGFANTFIGRLVFGFYLNQSHPKHIVRITPNSVHWQEGRKINAEFLTDNQYALRLQKVLYPLWKLFHIWDMAWYPNFNLGFDTLTANPDVHPETTSVDGSIDRDGVNENLATIRAGSGTGVSTSAGSDQLACLTCHGGDTNNFQTLTRSIFLFDTSSLTSAATISTATTSFYISSINDNLVCKVRLVTSNPTTNTDIVTNDFTTLGTTAQSVDVAIATMTTSAYNDWTLNATGLGNISKTSITKFGTVLDRDADANSPTWGASQYSLAAANFADAGSNKPKLVVTYTLPSTGFFAIL